MQIFETKTIEYLMKLFRGEIFTPDGNLDVEHEGSDPSHVRVKNDVGQLDLLVDNIGDRGLYDTTEYETGWLIKTDGLDTYLPRGDVKAANSIEAGVHISAVGDITAGRDASVGQDLTVTRDISAGRNITATGNVGADQDVAAGRNVSATGDVTAGGDATITGNVTAASFVVPSGTSAQFLKADGSLDPIDYLPLTGGTLTGSLSIKFGTDSSQARGISWKDTSDTNVARVIYHNTAQNIILNPTGASDVYYDAVGKYSLFVGNDKLTYNTYPILHTGNYTTTLDTRYVKQSDVGNITGLFTGSCTSAADAQVKEATVGNTFSLVDGVTVAIKFANTNTYSATAAAPVTLNVNNTGAKQIWYASSKANTGTASGIYGYADRYITYMYDATNDVWVFISHNFDADTNTQIRVYRQTSGYNSDYPILVSRTVAGSIGTVGTNSSYSAVYGVIFNTDQPTINPNTGKMKVKALAVNGVDITGNSDERLKDIQGNVSLSIEDIANAPSILYKRKDSDDEKIHLGSIAQYWEKIAPWAVGKDNDGMLTLDYPALSLAASIQCAREVVDLKKEVAELRAEIGSLKKQLMDNKE